jgi:hypothetical protein
MSVLYIVLAVIGIKILHWIFSAKTPRGVFNRILGLVLPPVGLVLVVAWPLIALLVLGWVMFVVFGVCGGIIPMCRCKCSQ